MAAAVSTNWEGLSRRQVAELTLPGAAIGLIAGMIAGGMATGGDLSLPVVLVATFGLGVPLALAGAGYEILLASGRVPLGPLAPAALYFAVAFPAARLLHTVLIDVAAGDPVRFQDGWAGFLTFQILLSVGFTIGFWWLHENFAPRWWFHLRDRNPVARHFISEQLQYVASVQEKRQGKG